MKEYNPGYLALYESGELKRRRDKLEALMKPCRLCPHACGVDRFSGERGKCRTGALPLVASFHAHHGEERCLSGTRGSGTIFFANCNLSCIFCQNYDISQYGYGDEVSYRQLGEAMLTLQLKGCHNINLVTPTHVSAAVPGALEYAVPKGLHLPLVYNCGGYESVETLELLEGIVDMYMPDFKYMDGKTAAEFSGVEDYPLVAMNALKEMHRQVGDLLCDLKGRAVRGLLVRHLVLPENRAATDRVFHFLVSLSPNTYVNIMDQYHPEYNARKSFDLRRRITLDEYERALVWAAEAGLMRIDEKRPC